MLSPSAYPERPSGTIETSSLGCSDPVRRFPDPNQDDLHQGRLGSRPLSAIRRHQIWGLKRPKKEPVPWPTIAKFEGRGRSCNLLPPGRLEAPNPAGNAALTVVAVSYLRIAR